jgi:hypothetical protein
MDGYHVCILLLCSGPFVKATAESPLNITNYQGNYFTLKRQNCYTTVSCVQIRAFWSQREYVPHETLIPSIRINGVTSEKSVIPLEFFLLYIK